MFLRIRRTAVVAIVLCIILTIAAGCGSSSPTATGSSKQPEPPKIEASVKSADLYAAYKANTVAADQKYKDKLLEVKGEIQEIGKDILDRLYVTLNGDEYGLACVQVFFPDSAADALAKLKKGDSLTIQGKCSGLNIINVEIMNGTIVK